MRIVFVMCPLPSPAIKCDPAACSRAARRCSRPTTYHLRDIIWGIIRDSRMLTILFLPHYNTYACLKRFYKTVTFSLLFYNEDFVLNCMTNCNSPNDF